MFQCDKLGSQCYSEKEHCNGIGHCSNKRDEQSCSEYSRRKAFLCGIVVLEDYVVTLHLQSKKLTLPQFFTLMSVLFGHYRSYSMWTTQRHIPL